MQQQPRRAKRLYFDVIPRAIDDYLVGWSRSCRPRSRPRRWRIRPGTSTTATAPANKAAGVTFGMLLNLASVANTDDKDVLWQYLRRYVPGATPENAPYLDRLLRARSPTTRTS